MNKTNKYTIISANHFFNYIKVGVDFKYIKVTNHLILKVGVDYKYIYRLGERKIAWFMYGNYALAKWLHSKEHPSSRWVLKRTRRYIKQGF